MLGNLTHDTTRRESDRRFEADAPPKKDLLASLRGAYTTARTVKTDGATRVHARERRLRMHKGLIP